MRFCDMIRTIFGCFVLIMRLNASAAKWQNWFLIAVRVENGTCSPLQPKDTSYL